MGTCLGLRSLVTNGAEIDDQAITHEHAEYLRDKFLRGRAV